MTTDEWIEEAIKELVAAGFNWTEGLRGYAKDLYAKHAPSLTPKQAVEEDLSNLE